MRLTTIIEHDIERLVRDVGILTVNYRTQVDRIVRDLDALGLELQHAQRVESAVAERMGETQNVEG